MTKNEMQLPNPDSVVFVHYLCDEFGAGERIYNLMLARGDDSQIRRWDVTSEKTEAKAIKDYFDHIENKCRGLRVVHWNQCASYYGPAHLNARYKALTGIDAGFDYFEPLGLSDLLIRKYGDKFIGHSRLDALATLNNFTGIRSTSKDSPTFPDQRLLLISKIYFAEYRGELKILKHALNTEKTIEDFLVSHKEEIVEYLKTELFKQKGKKVAVVIYALKELSLIDVSERRELYNALRKLLGEIGTDESMNKVLRDQVTQLKYSTQESIRVQKEKIKRFLS
jgi:hypothetical protein